MFPPQAQPEELPTVPEGGTVCGTCVIGRSDCKPREAGFYAVLAAEGRTRVKISWIVYQLLEAPGWVCCHRETIDPTQTRANLSIYQWSPEADNVSGP
jgi:hypothetical protein